MGMCNRSSQDHLRETSSSRIYNTRKNHRRHLFKTAGTRVKHPSSSKSRPSICLRIPPHIRTSQLQLPYHTAIPHGLFPKKNLKLLAAHSRLFPKLQLYRCPKKLRKHLPCWKRFPHGRHLRLCRAPASEKIFLRLVSAASKAAICPFLIWMTLRTCRLVHLARTITRAEHQLH